MKQGCQIKNMKNSPLTLNELQEAIGKRDLERNTETEIERETERQREKQRERDRESKRERG
jgi:hypothetical protein